jgi:hypothetical protein
MAESNGFSWPVRIVFQWVLTIALVWFLSINLEQYFLLNGGLPAYIIIGSLLTLMNLIVPFHFIFGMIATIMMSWLFLWITLKIANQMDPTILLFGLNGGVGGWIVVSLILGIANWLMKIIVKA